MDMRVQKWQHDRNTVDKAENTVDEFPAQTTEENITSQEPAESEEEPQEEEQDGESDGMMTVPDNVDEETDTDVPSGDYDSTDDSGMPLPFSEGDDDYPYDDPMEE